MTENTEYAEDLPYFKTSTTSPDGWLEKAKREIQRAGGEVISCGFGESRGQQVFMLQFELHGDSFRINWPVLETKYSNADNTEVAYRRQAATMLYHDVKAACVKARALGARLAFFAHLELSDGRTAAEVSGAEVLSLPDLLAGPKRLTGGELITDAEVLD